MRVIDAHQHLGGAKLADLRHQVQSEPDPDC